MFKISRFKWIYVCFFLLHIQKRSNVKDDFLCENVQWSCCKQVPWFERFEKSTKIPFCGPKSVTGGLERSEKSPLCTRIGIMSHFEPFSLFFHNLRLQWPSLHQISFLRSCSKFSQRTETPKLHNNVTIVRFLIVRSF